MRASAIEVYQENAFDLLDHRLVHFGLPQNLFTKLSETALAPHRAPLRVGGRKIGGAKRAKGATRCVRILACFQGMKLTKVLNIKHVGEFTIKKQPKKKKGLSALSGGKVGFILERSNHQRELQV